MQVVFLNAPLTEKEMAERLTYWMTCPCCMSMYKCGTSESLPVTYSGQELAVVVCPICAATPPENYGDILVAALENQGWSTPAEVNLEE